MAYLLILAGFIYLFIKISGLSARIRALEDAEARGVSIVRQSVRASDGEAFVKELSAEALSDHHARVTPSVAPSPAPSPTHGQKPLVSESAPVPTESSEEKGARWLGRIGIVALLFGVAFFLKYAFDNDWIGPMGRVMMGVLAGIGMIGVGHRFRSRYGAYADLWLGGGIGVLYLSMYASFAFYQLISQGVAFSLMALVTALALVLAVSGGTINIAAIGVFGGFLTPIMLRTGVDNLVQLSLYMIILNLGVLGVAWFKKWTKLNYLTFLGTITLFGGWMSSFYRPERLEMTFFFLTIFFLLFLATSVMHHFARKEVSTPMDQLLLLANAAGYFGVCYGILKPEYDAFLGFFALLLALVYLAVGYVSYSSNKGDRTMNLMLPGIAVVFLTIAIPLQLDGYTVSLSWLIEALVLIAISLFIRERVIQVFGWIVLMLGTAGVFNDVGEIHAAGEALTPFWNTGFFLMTTLVAVLYAISWLYVRFKDDTKESRQSMLLTLFLANLFTAMIFTVELKPKFHTWEALPWFIEGAAVLAIGLYYRSRMTEVFGWLFVMFGTMLLLGDINDIRAGKMLSVGGVQQFTIPAAFVNLGFFLMLCLLFVAYGFLGIYRKFEGMNPDWKKTAAVIVVVANLLTIASFTSEISFKYDRKIEMLYRADQVLSQERALYVGNSYGMYGAEDYIQVNATSERVKALRSSKDTAITIFWAFYATLLLVIGFMRRVRAVRLFGLAFFFVTAIKVFIDVYDMGQIYRIISFIVFGLIAVSGSFLYAKYKHRIKEIIYD